MITSGDIYTYQSEDGVFVRQRQTLFGLSTDSKPTNVGNGSTFIEMNTGKIYFFDAAGSTWRAWGA